MSDYFGDAVYEVWRRGGNPDLVTRDLHSEEDVEREVDRLTRRRSTEEEDE